MMKPDDNKYERIKLSKKAFTLVELIAVLVILSIVIAMSVVLVINIRRSILQKEYENLVLYLETKGAEYAEDTSVIVVSVEDLIKEGYVKPDDDTDIYDPRSKESMNCYLIRMSFENNNYVAKLSENLGRNNDGTCKAYTKISEFDICVYDDEECIIKDKDEWFNTSVTLGILYRGKLLNDEISSFRWTSNTGFTSNEATVVVDGILLDSTYKCDIKSKDENGKDIIGSLTKKIKIDKEPPIINEVRFDKNWNVNKNVEIIASDGIGSGVDGYAIVKENEECSGYVSSKNININSNDKYKVCVKDKAGNETTELMEITTILKIPDKPKVITRLGNNAGEIYNGTWTSKGIYISMNPSNNDDVIARYEYKIDNGVWIKFSDLIIKNNVGNYVYNKDINGIIYIRACNEAGCSVASDGNLLKIDTKSPTIKAKAASNNIKFGTNNNVSTYFNASYSMSGGTLSCTPESTGSLKVGTYTLKCVAKGNNGLSAEATTLLKVVPLTPSKPTIITKFESSTGEIYNGSWTNKSIYIEINPGASYDVVTKFEYKIGNGNWVTGTGTIKENIGSFVYSSDIDNTIYVRNCYQDNCSVASDGKILKIDKKAPTCKLTANSSKISFKEKSSDVKKFGITTSEKADYTNSTKNISTGKFYGYVMDEAGNTGSCSIEITETSSSRSCREVCSEGTQVCDLVCYYNASSTEIARKSCNKGAYEPTWKTCYSAYYSSCPSDFPIIDTTASRCYTTGGGCTTSCTTSYKCEDNYTKIDNNYCYK